LEERNELFTRDAARRGSGASRAAAAGTAPEPYLGFQMVFWTDSAGMQVAKWTPRRTNTRPVSVGDRPYFTELRRRVGWQLDGADIGLEGPVQYYLQSLRSKTTGEHVVALSLPFCWSSQAWAASPCPGGNEGVGVILTPLASVDQPVLPGGVAFAIVDPEGRTLFHSRPERVLDENFFEETNGNPNLRSLVSARVRDRLDGHYLGRSTRMHVRPITGTPLSLVVVLDDQYLGSVHFQTLALALAMFGAWILVLWGLFVFVEMVTPGRLQWAWPARDQPNRYRTLVMVLGAAVLLLSLQGVLAIWSPVHPSVVLVPVQALALGLLVLTGGRPHPPHLVVPFWRTPSFLGWAGLGVATLLQIALHWDPGWQHLVLLALQLAFVGWGAYRVATLRLPGKAKDPQRTVQRLYVASITLTLAVVGLLPAALFYEDSFAAHLERFVRYQQVQIVDGLRARADRVWTANRTSGLPESYDTLALAGTSDLAFGGFLASTPIPPGAPLPAARPCRWQLGTTLHRLKPIVRTPAFYVTDVAARMANLTRPETDGYAWTCAGDTLQLVARGYTLRSRIPSGLWHPTRWWVLGLLVGVAILLWVPTWLGRRVFLLGLDTPGATVLSDVLEHVSTSGRSLVIVCTRSMDRERLRDILNEKEIGYLDLPELAEDDEDANARALREAAKGAGAICMDHFDQQLDQESWARPLLEHLEHLVFGEGRQVLLLTSREPSGLVPRLGAKGEGGVEDRLRWTRLLGRFVKVRIAAFRLDHEAEPSAVATPPGEPMPERLGAVLRHESRGHPFLRKVADQAAAHTDFEMLTPDALVDQVREMADGYYHALWSILEREEKVVVAQLAESVVVNPKCERAIRRLLEREVLVFDPELRLMNESFARFVREEIPAGRVDTWERDV
ncbi:MAG TPA: cache domain-containing protein, partial [Longimicrobiales bacterium]|nr:cache domain-containing protein [Longimicrobiales bacterium]